MLIAVVATRPVPTSSGTDRKTGPGRGPIAIRRALDAKAAAAEGSSSRALQRVMVRTIATTSIALVDAS